MKTTVSPAQLEALREIAKSTEEWCWTSIRRPTLLALRDRGLVELKTSETYAYYRTRSGSHHNGAAQVHYTHDVAAKLTDAGRALTA